VTGEKTPLLHPGVFLREILEEHEITQVELAKASGISPMRVSHVTNGTRPITAELALRFGRVFGQTPQYWLNLKSLYDLDKPERSLGNHLKEIRPMAFV
jgi:addiction module HigA family antidote